MKEKVELEEKINVQKDEAEENIIEEKQDITEEKEEDNHVKEQTSAKKKEL